MSGPDLISAIDKWREQGRELRKQLIAERNALAAKVAEIDSRLSAMPQESDADPAPPAQLPTGSASGSGHFTMDDASVPAMVSSILKHATRPLSAAEIIRLVQDSRTGIKPEMVHSAIYRLKERDAIAAQGDRGSRTFTWAGKY